MEYERIEKPFPVQQGGGFSPKRLRAMLLGVDKRRKGQDDAGGGGGDYGTVPKAHARSDADDAVAAGRPIRLPAAALASRRIDSSTAMTTTASRRAWWTTDAAVLPSRRRWLVGPGSSPPTCRARCGRCTPCRATRVAIQPGVGPQWEYYPEVWRCKCGNKLFMP